MIVESDIKRDRVNLTTEYLYKVDEKRTVKVVPEYLPVDVVGMSYAMTGPDFDDWHILPVYSGRVRKEHSSDVTTAENGAARFHFVKSEPLPGGRRGVRGHAEFYWRNRTWKVQVESDGGRVLLNAAKERVVPSTDLVRVFHPDLRRFQVISHRPRNFGNAFCSGRMHVFQNTRRL